MRTFYEILEVPRTADAAAIRASYRKLALIHHPDRSKAANAAARFAALADAYATLSDPEKRREYDVQLTLTLERQARAANRAQVSQSAKPQTVGRPKNVVSADLARLTALFSRGRFQEAEVLAHSILEVHPREAGPYAILGDIARARGELNHAANMYAHAAQMDPRNPLYQQRYEELLVRAAPGAAAARGGSSEVTGHLTAVLIGGLGCCYLALANEKPLFKSGLIDSLTLGAVVMLFLIGVAIGAAYSVGGVVDRFASVSYSSSGRLSPAVALGSVAIASFWVATLLYSLLAFTQKANNQSVTKLIVATVAAVFVATLAAIVSPVLHPGQVLLWGGNFAYIGAVCGWMTADALRR